MTHTPALTADPGQPIPYTLTAKAHAALDQDNSRGWREEDPPPPATTGPDEWGCERCGAAYLGTPPEDGLCPPCRAGQDGR
jgi:rubrerythrin